MSIKRLNKMGRGLFGTKMYLQGVPIQSICTVLNVEECNIKNLVSKGVGMLGLFDGQCGCNSGVDICEYMTITEAVEAVHNLEILIVRKGDKLFYREPVKGEDYE